MAYKFDHWIIKLPLLQVYQVPTYYSIDIDR